MKMKKMLKLFVTISLLIFATACGEKKEEIKNAETVKEKIYVVGTNAEYPPFEYLENDKIVGLDAEIIAAIAEKTGIQYKWANQNFDGLIPALQSKKVDIVIAGMSITQERAKAVNFSIPYLSSKVAFIANKENPINGVDDLENKSYAAELGTTKEAAAKKIKGATVVPFSSTTAALIALKSKKVDGMVLDESVANEYIKNNSELMLVAVLEGEPKAIAFNKEDTELMENFNKALQELLDDGTIQKIREKYGI